VVIGNNLNAVLHAYKTNSLLINNTVACIFPLDAIDDEINLGHLNFIAGAKKIEVAERLSHELAMMGMNPLGTKNESVRLRLDENEISVTSNFFRRVKLRFSNLTIFDTENVSGLPFEAPKTSEYRVLDWFNVRSGMKHDNWILNDDSKFVEKIHFYISPRILGDKPYKDLVAESYLNEDQLRSVDYTDSIVRLKVINMMKHAGIKGSSNGGGTFLPLKIELDKRDVLPLKKPTFMKYNNITLDTR